MIEQPYDGGNKHSFICVCVSVHIYTSTCTQHSVCMNAHAQDKHRDNTVWHKKRQQQQDIQEKHQGDDGMTDDSARMRRNLPQKGGPTGALVFAQKESTATSRNVPHTYTYMQASREDHPCSSRHRPAAQTLMEGTMIVVALTCTLPMHLHIQAGHHDTHPHEYRNKYHRDAHTERLESGVR